MLDKELRAQLHDDFLKYDNCTAGWKELQSLTWLLTDAIRWGHSAQLQESNDRAVRAWSAFCDQILEGARAVRMPRTRCALAVWAKFEKGWELLSQHLATQSASSPPQAGSGADGVGEVAGLLNAMRFGGV